MNARVKLNHATINGAILFAALAGWLSNSWIIFLLAVATLLALSVYTGEFRASPTSGRYRAAR